MSLNIVFSNKPSTLNQKLIKFFQINLLSLNKASMVFEFEVAHPSEIDSFVKRGIKNYPVLVDKKTSVTGVEKIIQYLKLCVKRHNNKILSKTDDEKLDDFWKQTIGDIEVDESGNIKPDDDEEGSTDAGDNLHHRIQEAFEQRSTETAKPASLKSSARSSQGNTQLNRNNNLSDDSPVKTLSNMKSGRTEGKNADDVLMAKFFENQEES